MKRTAAVALVALAITSTPRLVAQMRPGAKVEKTYGIGLPRDMDRLLIPDADYPVYPLKPGQEAYADVDGYRIKETIKKITAISLQSLDAGELYWGRIPGTKYHQLAMDFMAAEYGRLGLQVLRRRGHPRCVRHRFSRPPRARGGSSIYGL